LVEFTAPKGQSREVAAGETLGVSETATGDTFTPNPPGAAELLPATNSIDGQLRQIVPPKTFEGSEASSQKVSKAFIDIETPISPKMIRVDGGTLPKESKLGGQSVKTFEIGNYEVTWNEWRKVQDWAVKNGYDIGDVGKADGYNQPVTEVSWYDAVKWCNAKSEMNRLEPVYRINGKVYKTGEIGLSGPQAVIFKNGANGYRLPTSLEWEWAARGGKKSQGYIFSGSNDLNLVGWFKANCDGKPLSVGQKEPNELEIHDMSGNAIEWAWDTKFNVRGGCSQDPAEWCRSDFLYGIKLNYADRFLGFRLARSL